MLIGLIIIYCTVMVLYFKASGALAPIVPPLITQSWRRGKEREEKRRKREGEEGEEKKEGKGSFQGVRSTHALS